MKYSELFFLSFLWWNNLFDIYFISRKCNKTVRYIKWYQPAPFPLYVLTTIVRASSPSKTPQNALFPYIFESKTIPAPTMDQLLKCDANYVPLTPITFLKRANVVYANRTSVIYEGTRFTWSQTYERCCRLADSLRSLNVGKNDVVRLPSFILCFFFSTFCCTKRIINFKYIFFSA